MTTTAADFFYEHAGYSYNTAIETPEQGRRRTAQALADAELWAHEAGYSVDWEDDWDVTDHVAEYDTYDTEPATCEQATMHDPDGAVVASLGCIDDATDEYRRVVEAELALEAKP
jgi:hypothetical protein